MKKITLLLLVCVTYTAIAQHKYYPVEMRNKWGYMDAEGSMVLPATFDYADEFYEGLAIVAVRNLPCVINEKGMRIIDTGLYQNISHFSQGLAAAMDFDGRKFYINTKGEKIITLPADIYESRTFSEGIAVVSKKLDEHVTKFGRDISTLGYRFAYMNMKGEFVTDFVFEDADDITNGYARFRQGTKFGLVNDKGEITLQPAFNNIGNFNNGMAVVDVDGKYGYINTQGSLIIKPQFDYAYGFTEELAGVLVKGKYGFINTTGTIVIEPAFEQIKPFAEGKAAAMKDGKWGFINKEGVWVLRNVFDNATVFSEGRCAVMVKRGWGFIDATGVLVIPADYDAVGSFHDGIADVVYRDINLYINNRGQLLPIIEKKK
ncbi:MAG: WG repeat-containing protein [Bacteroidota bacterium]